MLLDEAARRMDEKAACAEEKVNAVWQRNLTSKGRVAEGNAVSFAAVRNCKNLTVALEVPKRTRMKMRVEEWATKKDNKEKEETRKDSRDNEETKKDIT